MYQNYIAGSKVLTGRGQSSNLFHKNSPIWIRSCQDECIYDFTSNNQLMEKKRTKMKSGKQLTTTERAKFGACVKFGFNQLYIVKKANDSV